MKSKGKWQEIILGGLARQGNDKKKISVGFSGIKMNKNEAFQAPIYLLVLGIVIKERESSKILFVLNASYLSLIVR